MTPSDRLVQQVLELAYQFAKNAEGCLKRGRPVGAKCHDLQWKRGDGYAIGYRLDYFNTSRGVWNIFVQLWLNSTLACTLVFPCTVSWKDLRGMLATHLLAEQRQARRHLERINSLINALGDAIHERKTDGATVTEI